MKRNLPFTLALLAGLSGSFAGVPADAATATDLSPAEETSLTSDPAAMRAVEKWGRASRDILRRHLPSVAARGDAGALLAASLLWPEIENAGISDAANRAPQAWFETAMGMRPRDPNIAWVQVTDCPLVEDSCDAEAALDFLLLVEADNAAVQLLAMAEAKDPEAMERYWQAAAASSVYDTHMREIGALLQTAMRDVAMPSFTPALAETLGTALGLDRAITPRDARNVHALAAWMALAIPSFKVVTDRCKPKDEIPMDPIRKAQCERVLKLLADDQSIVISPMIALATMVRLDGDTAQGLVSRERLRQLYWIYENAFPNRPAHGPTGAFPDDYAEQVLLEGEVQAMRRVLESRNLPAVAPAAWLPSSERVRALVTTGRAPQS